MKILGHVGLLAPSPSPPPGRISSHVCSALILGFICAQCPADVCLQIALHRPRLAPAVLTGSWCSPLPTGATLLGMELGTMLGTHTGTEKIPSHLSPPHAESVTQQNKGANTEMFPRSGGARVQHPCTEHIWLTDPKLSLRSPFFHQQVHAITGQHTKAISSSSPHILNCTLCFYVCHGTTKPPSILIPRSVFAQSRAVVLRGFQNSHVSKAMLKIDLL